MENEFAAMASSLVERSSDKCNTNNNEKNLSNQQETNFAGQDISPLFPCDNHEKKIQQNIDDIMNVLDVLVISPDETSETDSADNNEANSSDPDEPKNDDSAHYVQNETSGEVSQSCTPETVSESASPVPLQDTETNSNAEIMNSINLLALKVDSMNNVLETVKNKLVPLDGYQKIVNQVTPTLDLLRRSEENAFKEAEQYKNDFLYTIIKPFLDSFIELSKELAKSKVDYEGDKESILQSNSESFYNEVIGLHTYLQQTVDGMLIAHGVIKKVYTAETEYIPLEQKAVKTVLTDDPAKEGMVAAVISDAYIYSSGNKVIRQANVHVYKVQKSQS